MQLFDRTPFIKLKSNTNLIQFALNISPKDKIDAIRHTIC